MTRNVNRLLTLRDLEKNEAEDSGLDLEIDALRGMTDSAFKTALDALYVGRMAQVLTPEDFGAKGDGRTVTDAVLASNTTVTSATAAFTSADVGKRLVVLPAVGSSQPAFATTITGINSATSVAVQNTAGYSGSGLEMTVASDDTTALQSWLSDSRGHIRLLPGKIYGFTAGLVLGGHYDVLCSVGSTLKVMAQLAAPTGWPGAARTVPTAISTSFTVLNRSGSSWTGGQLDCSLLCDDGFAPKWVRTYTVSRLMVRAPKVRMFNLGDGATTSSSYQVVLDNCLGWRDFGVVPQGAQALNGVQLTTSATASAAADTVTANGHGLVAGQMVYFSAITGAAGLATGTSYQVANPTTNTFQLKAVNSTTVIDITTDGSAMTLFAQGLAGSIGVYIDANCTDSSITNKTTMMGAQVGYENHAGNLNLEGAHCWARAAIGWMDYGFDDYAGHSQYISTYSDTPRYAGYRLRSTYNKMIGAVAYNNNGGTDNSAIGFMMDSAGGANQFIGCTTSGADSSHRFARDYGRPDGTVFNPPHPMIGNTSLNVTTAHGDTTPAVSTNSQSGSYSLFGADANNEIEMTNSGAAVITLTQSIPVGCYVGITLTGTGSITFAAGSGITTVNQKAGTTGLSTRYGRVRVYRAFSGVYWISGDLT